MSLHTFAAPSALSLQYVPLAQLVEYQTFNLGVAGSSPRMAHHKTHPR